MTSITRPTFGMRLHKTRKQRGWSLTVLWRESGIHKGTLSELEHGKYEPGMRTLMALSDALGVSMDYLAKGR